MNERKMHYNYYNSITENLNDSDDDRGVVVGVIPHPRSKILDEKFT